ncbi:MAG TPA: hypothetical protein VHE30_09195 [Polyangiaceae bacterium]|nr:hypothetical protein [Polyangiaceae bacterium]
MFRVQTMASGLGCVLLIGGCSAMMAKDDGRAFGDDLGRFTVTAHLDSSTCGAGAMDAPADWTFDVVLSEKSPTLYWNTGADAVEGALAADGKAFAFKSETVVNVDATGTPTTGSSDPDTQAARAVCTVIREDSASGALDSGESPSAFSGSLGYSFSPQGASDCTGLLASGGFATLPCAMTYRMTGTRVADR